MVVFLYRPSPQVPRPSVSAALKVFEACRYNIYVQREQITMGNVDLTWIFTQAIFMAINSLLWSLSYAEVRRQNPKPDVQKHLITAMDAIRLASERWPGVTSAIELYEDLMRAILKSYDKDGDIPLNETTPSDSASPANTFSDHSYSRSRTTSPGVISASSITTPPERVPIYGYFSNPRIGVEQPPPMPYQAVENKPPRATPPLVTPPIISPPLPQSSHSSQPLPRFTGPEGSPAHYASTQQSANFGYDGSSHFKSLPNNFPDISGWRSSYNSPQRVGEYDLYGMSSPNDGLTPPTTTQYPGSSPIYGSADPATAAQETAEHLINPSYWGQDVSLFGAGLDQTQQMELMQSLETNGMEDIQHIITATTRAFGQRSQNG